MPGINYPIQNIQLASDEHSLQLIRKISLVGGIIILTIAVIFAIDWLFRSSFLSAIFGNKIINGPLISVLILNSLLIIFHSSFPKKHKKYYFIFVGFFNFFVGIFTLLASIVGKQSFFNFFSAQDLVAGLIIIFIGQSLLITFLSPFRRFHYAQIVVFFGLLISLFGLLQGYYRFVLLGGNNLIGENSFFTFLLFVILCLAILLIHADRGLVSFFTTNSNSSQLARMTFMYIVVFAPIVGTIISLIDKLNLFDDSGRLTLTIILFLCMFIFIVLISVKSMYASEVELYLMKESLRVNNITLELNADDLSTKVNSLEESEREVVKKLTYQQSLSDLIDSSG